MRISQLGEQIENGKIKQIDNKEACRSDSLERARDKVEVQQLQIQTIREKEKIM